MNKNANQIIEQILTIVNRSNIKDFSTSTFYNGLTKEVSVYDNLQGLSLSELHVIAYIGSNEFTNATDISLGTSITKGGISKITNRLVTKKLIVCDFKAGNKKEKYYALTKAGKEVFLLHEQFHQESLNKLIKLISSFSEHELSILKRFFDGLVEI
ncbi:DNA-binding transcriptional regulator, MarR family [Lacrimispora sphenoides]|jgi:DNA-binding MarR family transcriptional regulator|uniref:MarR family winged helix-turn-helix transcriptional regulator n=1 Tax=Lacrimispora sphenoides TaxID=29370 RepID=UPI0008CB05A7|nr:hypothetical protein [Lacrimispora sphenoides]SEU28861.1 DNA-binding transcriptional regulator, MarR family [Lacrimispora sphenoides]